MPRKTVGGEKAESFDFDPLIEPGMMVLKFGRGGTPHERLLRITGNLRFIYWEAGWFCSKVGKTCYGKVVRSLHGLT